MNAYPTTFQTNLESYHELLPVVTKRCLVSTQRMSDGVWFRLGSSCVVVFRSKMLAFLVLIADMKILLQRLNETLICGYGSVIGSVTALPNKTVVAWLCGT